MVSDRDRIDEVPVAVQLPPDEARPSRYIAAHDALHAGHGATMVDVGAPDASDGMHPVGDADWRDVAAVLEESLGKHGAVGSTTRERFATTPPDAPTRGAR